MPPNRVFDSEQILVCKTGGHNKFYILRTFTDTTFHATEPNYVRWGLQTRWGRIKTRGGVDVYEGGQTKEETFSHVSYLRAKLNDLVWQKIGKGYQRVPTSTAVPVQTIPPPPPPPPAFPLGPATIVHKTKTTRKGKKKAEEIKAEVLQELNKISNPPSPKDLREKRANDFFKGAKTQSSKLADCLTNLQDLEDDN